MAVPRAAHRRHPGGRRQPAMLMFRLYAELHGPSTGISRPRQQPRHHVTLVRHGDDRPRSLPRMARRQLAASPQGTSQRPTSSAVSNSSTGSRISDNSLSDSSPAARREPLNLDRCVLDQSRAEAPPARPPTGAEGRVQRPFRERRRAVEEPRAEVSPSPGRRALSVRRQWETPGAAQARRQEIPNRRPAQRTAMVALTTGRRDSCAA
jgi:hypothetical protein